MYTTIGNYQFGKEYLGVGQFSKVYRGWEITRRKTVAIKHINLTFLSKRVREALTRECEILKKLDHPGVIKLFDSVVSENHWYLVMEYCNAGTLHDVMAYLKKFPPDEREPIAQYYLQQLMLALAHLHEHHVVHRDVKPANILLTAKNFRSGEYHPDYRVMVKLSDYGLSTLATEGQMCSTMCGTPLYMAPEMVLEQPYHDNVDLWSFGIVMYEMIYGTNPMEARNLQHLKQRHQEPVQFPSGVSESAIDLMSRLLKWQPEERISWEDFTQHRWFRGEESPPDTPPPTRFSEPIRIMRTSLQEDDLRRERHFREDGYVMVDSSERVWNSEPKSMITWLVGSLTEIATKFKSYNSY